MLRWYFVKCCSFYYTVEKAKMSKLRLLLTEFGFCGGVVVVLWWGCGLIGDSKYKSVTKINDCDDILIDVVAFA